MNRLTRNGKACSVLVSMVFAMFFGVMVVHAAPPWEQTQKLLAGDGTINDYFGNSITTSGNLAVIGAPSKPFNNTDSGRAYVFDLTTGAQLFKLLPDDGAVSDRFGISIAVDGNLAVIGADHGDGIVKDTGAVYVFDITTGQQLLKLTSLDGAAKDNFGSSVALVGNLAVVGAPYDDDHGASSGSAYVFDITTGQQLFKLLPSDGMANDQFGMSVALNGNIVVVGSPFADGNYMESGSVYTFDVTNGQQLAKMYADDGSFNSTFGWSVSVSGNLVLIGAHNDSVRGDNSGSAYVFDLSSGQQILKLHPEDANGNMPPNFGISVLLNGDLAVIGALNDGDNGAWSGAAYIYDITTGQLVSKLLADDGVPSDNFGSSIAMSGNEVVMIGAPLNADNGIRTGSVYRFDLRTTNYLSVEPFILHPNKPSTFSMVGTLPDEQSWILYSLEGLGKTFIHRLNVTIDLLIPRIAAGPLLTDANGDLQIILTIPGNHPRYRRVWFQTVQHNNVTNFIQTKILLF